MTETNLPSHVGVYGGGQMGAGIAHSFLVQGSSVTIVEVDQATASAAHQRVVDSLSTARDRGKLDDDLDTVVSHLSVSHDPAALATSQLVIEAVPEDPDLKSEVLARIDAAAPAADIDTAMTLGYRHPVGPLRTTDIVGLDVRLAIAEHLAKEVSSRFEPPALLRQLVADGKTGRKSGEGFYQW